MGSPSNIGKLNNRHFKGNSALQAPQDSHDISKKIL